MKTKTKIFLLILPLCTVALVALFQTPLRWHAAKIHREIFPEQVPERPIYDDTAKDTVDLATFVQDARRAWPKADVAVVHGAAMEVATGLLMRPDIEVGAMVDGKFVPWRMRAWQASGRIREEIGGMPRFLSEPNRYVFRRKST